jgi:hypothetical protein
MLFFIVALAGLKFISNQPELPHELPQLSPEWAAWRVQMLAAIASLPEWLRDPNLWILLFASIVANTAESGLKRMIREVHDRDAGMADRHLRKLEERLSEIKASSTPRPPAPPPRELQPPPPPPREPPPPKWNNTSFNKGEKIPGSFLGLLDG